MNPFLKYTLGRIGLFLLVFAATLPLPLNILVKVMIAFVISFALARFVLTQWLDESGKYLSEHFARRAAERQRLRSALAGDEGAAAAGDCAAVASDVTEGPGNRAV